MAQIKTVPEIAEAHAKQIKGISLKTSSLDVAISYTDIGDIHTGAEVNNSSYVYANEIQTDLQNYAQNIVSYSNKVVADDQSQAQGFAK